MFTGQRLGPFLVEKEIGAGAMGAVYLANLPPPDANAAEAVQRLARALKPGQKFAIKVMSPGVGSTNPNAVKRFERESAVLKQMKHPHIVRVYAIGKERGIRYFAMELIDGESLDKVLARRSRLSWEEVVDLGKQLCSALQHAHEHGIVHRDLKPSNLMILRDGTLKLTDFGIAKDLDETALTSANCTVGTAAYMSPEQCRGERDLTFKSDLYSLGVVLYELVTGYKPFLAENAMEMFMLHVQGTPERPSRRVLDLPIWLDNLICQLMEKSPDKRPRDAATVGTALKGIQEKVEAQQSAGVETARSRVVDRVAGQPRPDAEDRTAALSLLGVKVRGKRKKKKPFYEKVWFRAAGLLAMLAGIIVLLFLVFRPPSPERLYQRAERLMASGDSEAREKAMEGPIKEYLQRYESLADERTAQIKKWADDYEVELCEQKLQTHLQRAKKGRQLFTEDALEKQAFAAAETEEKGDLGKAEDQWKEVEQAGSHRWQLTAQRHLQRLKNIAETKARLEELYATIARLGRLSTPSDPREAQALLAVRYEHVGDLPRAIIGFDELKEKVAEDPAQREWYLLAVGMARELHRREKGRDFTDADREREIKRNLDEARKQLSNPQNKPAVRAAKGICLDLLDLYGKSKDDRKLKPLLDQAYEVLTQACAELDERPPPRPTLGETS
jgi:serine/threonine-protein kinase